MSANLSLRALLRGSALASADAKVLMAYVLEKHYQLPRSALLSRDELELNDNALEDWKKLESKRLQGEPVAYLIGKRGFHNIELYVAPGVLIPRQRQNFLWKLAYKK